MSSTTGARAVRLAWAAAGTVLLIVAWSILAAFYPSILLPSPLEVVAALCSLAASGELARELATTVWRLLVAFALGGGLGIALGLAGGRAAPLAALLRPIMAVLAGVPPISWLALALIWFGTGSLAPIVVAWLVAMPAVFVATLEGMRALDRDLADMARAFGLQRLDMLREVYLPALTPHLLSGLSTAAALTVRVGVMGEFLASSTGVGSAMALARTRLETAEVLAWVVVALGLLMLAEGLLLRPLARRAAAWRKEG